MGKYVPEHTDVEPGRWDQPAKVPSPQGAGQPEGNAIRGDSGTERSHGTAYEAQGLVEAEARNDRYRYVPGQVGAVRMEAGRGDRGRIPPPRPKAREEADPPSAAAVAVEAADMGWLDGVAGWCGEVGAEC